MLNNGKCEIKEVEEKRISQFQNEWTKGKTAKGASFSTTKGLQLLCAKSGWLLHEQMKYVKCKSMLVNMTELSIIAWLFTNAQITQA